MILVVGKSWDCDFMGWFDGIKCSLMNMSYFNQIMRTFKIVLYVNIYYMKNIYLKWVCINI